MDLSDLPTEIFTVNPERSLAKTYLEWMPQPGNYVEVDGNTYIVLERRHRYQLKAGRYVPLKITVFVKLTQKPSEMSLLKGLWVIGDIRCRYNAHSEFIRCAVNPDGPCYGCMAWESLSEANLSG